ncbi:UNVERIFIED_CONTAM: hypothetical protein ABID98_000294 [Brevibacillus sp. OAP136]
MDNRELGQNQPPTLLYEHSIFRNNKENEENRVRPGSEGDKFDRHERRQVLQGIRLENVEVDVSLLKDRLQV